MSMASIKARLLEVQADDDTIRMHDVSSLRGSIEELCELTPNELADRLLEWEPEAPDAVNLLLQAAARSERSALCFARALVQLLTARLLPEPECGQQLHVPGA